MDEQHRAAVYYTALLVNVGCHADAVLDASGHRVARRRAVVAGLTARELEVLILLARGMSNKQIAAKLVISPKTAGNRVEHIYAKIDSTSRASAAMFALRHGLLPDEEIAVPAR
jgi:DNA-binding NarL/FixJ family response regulator